MTKIVPIDIYNRDVMVHFGSRKELRKELSRIFGKSTAKEISEEFTDVDCGRTILLSGGR